MPLVNKQGTENIGRSLNGAGHHPRGLESGMALGFFNLGPRTHMSGQIGFPSILGGSQNLGDPPL